MYWHRNHNGEEWYEHQQEHDWTVVPSRRRRWNNREPHDPPRDHWLQHNRRPQQHEWVRPGPYQMQHENAFAVLAGEGLEPDQWPPLGADPGNDDHRGARRERNHNVQRREIRRHHSPDHRGWSTHKPDVGQLTRGARSHQTQVRA